MSVKLVDDLETPTARTSHVDRQNNCQDPKSNNRSGDANPLRPFVEYESDADEVGTRERSERSYSNMLSPPPPRRCR
jgi:hypothetical protein